MAPVTDSIEVMLTRLCQLAGSWLLDLSMPKHKLEELREILSIRHGAFRYVEHPQTSGAASQQLRDCTSVSVKSSIPPTRCNRDRSKSTWALNIQCTCASGTGQERGCS